MNVWTVLKCVDWRDSDVVDPVDNDALAKDSMLRVVGEIEGRYASTAPDASAIGEKFGAGVFVLLGPPSYGASRSVEVKHVEAVTEYREAVYEQEVHA